MEGNAPKVIDRNASAQQAEQLGQHVEQLRGLVEQLRPLRDELTQLRDQLRDQARQPEGQGGQVPLHPGNEPPTGNRGRAGSRPRSPHVETGGQREGEGE